MKIRTEPSTQVAAKRFLRRLWVAVFGSAILILAVLLRYGHPTDAWTWIGLGLFCLPLFAAPQRPRSARWWMAATLALFFLVHFPFERAALLELRSGQRGWLILPFQFRFAYDGPNTRFLQDRLGISPANWKHHTTDFMLFGVWRDGNERVDSHSPVYLAPLLEELLASLPHDAARRQVLECLADSQNLLRVHQGLLLSCVVKLGYPNGMTAQSWWEKHAWAFRRETDATRAARDVWGWTEKIEQGSNDRVGRELRAARFQQEGRWGGDTAFGDAFDALQRLTDGIADPHDPSLGVNRIVW